MPAPNKQQAHPVAVVGGGVVGLCCALQLQRDGRSVLLLDRLPPGQSTSKWSCGQLAVSEIIPVSKPGLLKKAPGWLLDQTGPLSIRPGAVPGLLPWMKRFVGNACMGRIQKIATDLASLSRHAFDDYAPLLENMSTDTLFNPKPPIQVYDSQKSLAEEEQYAAILTNLGFTIKHLSAEQLSASEPTMAGRFQYAVELSDWRTVRDTEAFLVALDQRFVEQGGERLTDTVTGFDFDGHAIRALHLENGSPREVSDVVIAAGHGSRRFFRQLNVKAPLIGIAGYQTVLPTPKVSLTRSIIYSDGGFGMIPMTRGLQIGGTIEFTGKSETPNYKRAETILKRARKILPDLDTAGAEFGVGFRPALPDTKPVIDRAPTVPNAVLAFGHGQLGLTLAATTGRLVADLVADRSPDISIAPFSLSRFR